MELPAGFLSLGRGSVIICMEFHIMGTEVLSSLFNLYDPAGPTQTIVYDPSQFGWNFLFAGLAVFSKTLHKTSSQSRNVCDFTRLLYRFVNFCWYDAIHIAATSRSLPVISRSLVTTSTLASSRISVRSVSISISMGILVSTLHPISKAEQRHPSWLSTGCSVGP